jgi:hypothetical protein
MKLCSVFALLHFGIITTVYAQNASFVAAQIEQISPCGVRSSPDEWETEGT